MSQFSAKKINSIIDTLKTRLADRPKVKLPPGRALAFNGFGVAHPHELQPGECAFAYIYDPVFQGNYRYDRNIERELSAPTVLLECPHNFNDIYGCIAIALEKIPLHDWGVVQISGIAPARIVPLDGESDPRRNYTMLRMYRTRDRITDEIYAWGHLRREVIGIAQLLDVDDEIHEDGRETWQWGIVRLLSVSWPMVTPLAENLCPDGRRNAYPPNAMLTPPKDDNAAYGDMLYPLLAADGAQTYFAVKNTGISQNDYGIAIMRYIGAYSPENLKCCLIQVKPASAADDLAAPALTADGRQILVRFDAVYRWYPQLVAYYWGGGGHDTEWINVGGTCYWTAFGYGVCCHSYSCDYTMSESDFEARFPSYAYFKDWKPCNTCALAYSYNSILGISRADWGDVPYLPHAGSGAFTLYLQWRGLPGGGISSYPYGGERPPEEDLYVAIQAHGIIYWYKGYGYGFYIYDCQFISFLISPGEDISLMYCWACTDEEDNPIEVVAADWHFSYTTELLTLDEYEYYVEDPQRWCGDVTPSGWPELPQLSQCWPSFPCEEW